MHSPLEIKEKRECWFESAPAEAADRSAYRLGSIVKRFSLDYVWLIRSIGVCVGISIMPPQVP